MNSIYIHGMEMPKAKYGVVLVIYPNGEVCFQNGEKYHAMEIPAHGRLIDADAASNSVNSSSDTDLQKFYFDAVIAGQPTIIPADQEETQ